MTASSIFSGLALTADRDGIEIRYPRRIHDLDRAAAAARAHGLTPAALDAESWVLRYPDAEDDSPSALKAFFADLNGYPPPYPEIGAAPVPEEPLVSCIVVVNENALFVREQLLPSLMANSGRQPLEIVLACNGPDWDDPLPAACRRVRADWGSVSAGYNAGARAGRGRYLAFFHDDCVIDDPRWIEKCLAALDGGIDAVAGEYRRMDAIAGVKVPALPIAKAVPLFMRRTDYFEAGGSDEFHYVGYEDLDLTLALLRRGKRLAPADIRHRHYNGMSSTLKYCPVPGLERLYAMTALPRHAIRQRFREFAEHGIRCDGVDFLQLALDVQLLYVLKKHGEFLAGIDVESYARARAALERRVTLGSPVDATLILPRFRELDRMRRQAARMPP